MAHVFGQLNGKEVRAVLLALLVAVSTLVSAPQLKAQQTELTLDQARVLAEQALAAGNFQLTGLLAQALLQADANDPHALILLASAEVAVGRTDSAATLAKQAFRATDHQGLKFRAARLAATAHYQAEQFTRAEMWLRRASNHAVTPDQERLVAAEFRTTRARNPWTIQMQAWVAPNDNVNNGSSEESVLLFNLPFVLSADAKALAGFEAAAGLSLRYKLNETKDRKTELGANFFTRKYELTDASKAAAPKVKGSDYAFEMAELVWSHIRIFDGASGPSQFQVTIGANTYGGAPFSRYGRLNFGQTYGLGETSSLQMFGSFEAQDNIRDGGVASKIYTLGANVNTRVAGGGVWGMLLQVQRTGSENLSSENDAVKLGVSYTFGTPVLGADLAVNVSAERRKFDAISLLAPTGRQDELVTIGATMTFKDLNFYGFSPSLSVDASRNRSNVNLYTREGASLKFGLVSRF